MKTWSQLEVVAKQLGFSLLRTPGCVTVIDGSLFLATITTEDVERDDHADEVCRAALSGALEVFGRQAAAERSAEREEARQ